MYKHVSHSQFCFCDSQSQSPKSHFPSANIGKSQFPFYPFRALQQYGQGFDHSDPQYGLDFLILVGMGKILGVYIFRSVDRFCVSRSAHTQNSVDYPQGFPTGGPPLPPQTHSGTSLPPPPPLTTAPQ